VTALKSVGAITLFVEDPQRAKSFYERAFGLSSVYEDENSAVFELENTLVNLLDVAQAPELIEPAPVASRDAGSSFQLTVWVDDADATCAELTGRGVSLLNGPIDRPWGVRTAAFADPDGHVWEIAQQLGGAAA
jgi:catechol 2,3-dioxygenase-like lactoylglutathione lyase family enzyme